MSTEPNRIVVLLSSGMTLEAVGPYPSLGSTIPTRGTLTQRFPDGSEQRTSTYLAGRLPSSSEELIAFLKSAFMKLSEHVDSIAFNFVYQLKREEIQIMKFDSPSSGLVAWFITPSLSSGRKPLEVDGNSHQPEQLEFRFNNETVSNLLHNRSIGAEKKGTPATDATNSFEKL